ncbi:MAG: WD40 repeat domain-containing protein, partial [Armatimonadetes bacterium]|nr:WD40 repeat domain-containing protein [Armatimonadota bacterium]
SLFSKRNMMLALVPVVIVIVCVVPEHILANKHSSHPAPGKDSKVRIAWRIQTNDVAHLAIAPGGRYFCTVDRKNHLNVYTIAGKQCYSAVIAGMDRAIVSPDGSYTLAYSYLDQSTSQVVVLDSAGQVCWKMNVSGAVWSADACLADGGSRFVVGTGKRCIYVFDIHGAARRYRWWRTPGAVVSLNIAPDTKSIIYGTWQDSALVRSDFDGNKLWQRNLDSASLHYVEQMGSPEKLMLRSMPNRRGVDGEFCLINADGVMIWKGILDVSAGTHVVCSSDGRFVCLGYRQVIEHKGKSVSEKHAILFDEAGERLWEKGSMFFQADPKLVTSNGEALLSDSKGALFIMRRNGAMEGLGKMPAPIIRSALSRDSKSLLLLCADKSLSKIEVSQ